MFCVRVGDLWAPPEILSCCGMQVGSWVLCSENMWNTPAEQPDGHCGLAGFVFPKIYSLTSANLFPVWVDTWAKMCVTCSRESCLSLSESWLLPQRSEKQEQILLLTSLQLLRLHTVDAFRCKLKSEFVSTYRVLILRSLPSVKIPVTIYQNSSWKHLTI